MAGSQQQDQVSFTSALALPVLRAAGFASQFVTTLILFETLNTRDFVDFTYLVSLIAILSTASMMGLPFYLLSVSGSKRRLKAVLPQAAIIMVVLGGGYSGVLVFLLSRTLEPGTLLLGSVAGVISVLCLALAKLGSVMNQLDNRMIRAHAPEAIIRPGILLMCAICLAFSYEDHRVYALSALFCGLALATVPGIILNYHGLLAIRDFKVWKKAIELRSLFPFAIISLSGTLFVNAEYALLVNIISDTRLLSEIRIIFQISIALQLAKQVTEMLFTKDIARSTERDVASREVLSKAIIYSSVLTVILLVLIPVGIYIVDDIFHVTSLAFVWLVLPQILLGQAAYILMTPCAIFLQMTKRAGLLASIQLSAIATYSIVLALTTPSSLELVTTYHSIFYLSNALLVLAAFKISPRGEHEKK